MVGRVDEDVSDADKRKLMLLLTEFRSAFSRDENDLGRTDIITHGIDTGDSKPVRQPLRRHPPAHLEAIRQHVGSMMEQGVIEPSRSPWASNIVLVKKKDGSLRCCVDYRQVNNLTRKDAYPLPRTDIAWTPWPAHPGSVRSTYTVPITKWLWIGLTPTKRRSFVARASSGFVPCRSACVMPGPRFSA